MGLDNILKVLETADKLPDLSRRQWLKLAAATATGASLASCASFPEATRGDVDRIKWDCNPVLPIPKKGGIYIGTNRQGGGRNVIVDNAEFFRYLYGKFPAFMAPGAGRVGASDGSFPWYRVNLAHSIGAIPMFRYVVTPKSTYWGNISASKGYSEINRGLKDEDIKKFGAEAAKLDKPIIVCPFQQVNDVDSVMYYWAGPNVAGAFKEAYVRIHDLWDKEGALEKVVMGLKFKVGSWEYLRFPDALNYIPPKSTFDIIGWCANNICLPNFNVPSKSFEGLLKNSYSRVVDKYPDKPQFIWELACNEPCNQAAWYHDALTKIEEKYHWIKAVNLDEMSDSKGSARVNPEPNLESQKVIKGHFTKPRYISTLLPVAKEHLETHKAKRYVYPPSSN